MQNIVLKESIKKIDKEFIQLNKKISDFYEVLSKLDSHYNNLNQLKAQTQISKSYFNEVKNQINKTNILENVANLLSTLEAFEKKATDVKNKIKEMVNFLEKFRTTRTYKIKDQKKIFRFLSGFLDGFAETFDFKPEFVGVIDLQKVADEVNGKAQGTKVIVKYNKLPKLIEFAYKNNLKNFVIESHNLKMTFFKDYKIKITSENKMIKKIDKVAKESDVELLN